MKKQDLMNTVKGALAKLKSNWKTPPEGYYVTYREFLSYALGNGSTSFIGVLTSWAAITINAPMMISYFKISSGFVFIAGIVASLLGLLRAPILSMIIDNSNSKKGKFKPFLLPSAILTVLFFVFIPFIPEGLNSRELFSFTIPSISIFDVQASHISISIGVALMFSLIQIGTFFLSLLTQCLVGIEQTISPVSQERANITALKGIISYMPASIVNIIIPLVAGIVFANSDNPMNNIALYRWAFPICGVGGILFVLFAYFGTEERTVVHNDFVSKVKLWEGTKQLLTNKYFWITTIFYIAVAVRANINMYMWICNYAIGGKNGAFALTLCNAILNSALVPAMLIGPILIKKMGKRNVMLMSTVGFLVMAIMQLFTLKSPYLMLVAVLFQNLFNGLSYVVGIMCPDALDYQQWKTGKRLEGFWQNTSGFIQTLFGFFTTALMPIFMSIGGVGFGDNIDVALKDPTIMENTFRSVTWLGIMAAVLAVVPICFYDLSEKKHADIIRALRIRAVVENYKNNDLSEEDKTSLMEILEYANAEKNELVLDELSKHSCIDEITNVKQ